MELERQFLPLCLHTALEADGMESLPLSSLPEDVQSPDDDFDKFDAIAYEKGEILMRKLQLIGRPFKSTNLRT